MPEDRPLPPPKAGVTEPAETATEALAARLNELLYVEGAETRDLDPELRALEATFSDAVYSELLFQLSHLRFEPPQAKTHWRQIVEHRGLMQERLGSFVDLRVALISYFVQVKPQFENPTIIEMRLFRQTEEFAYRDQLTGLRNYRFFSEILPQEVLRCDQYNAPLSLVMIDLDDFKAYNDRHGHEAGNRALAAIGDVLRNTLRKVDIAARYGGEEFALIAPSTPKTGARLVAERVRKAIETHPFAGEESQPGGRLTASLGVATYPGDADDAADLVRRADRAMYLAKAGGKNQIQLYGSNRRSHPRVEAALEGKLRLFRTDARPIKTLNVSEGGVRFVADLDLTVDELLDVTLELPNGRVVSLAGRVVSVGEGGAEGCEAAIRIIDIAAPDARALATFVRASRQAEA